MSGHYSVDSFGLQLWALSVVGTLPLQVSIRPKSELVKLATLSRCPIIDKVDVKNSKPLTV